MCTSELPQFGPKHARQRVPGTETFFQKISNIRTHAKMAGESSFDLRKTGSPRAVGWSRPFVLRFGHPLSVLVPKISLVILPDVFDASASSSTRLLAGCPQKEGCGNGCPQVSILNWLPAVG